MSAESNTADSLRQDDCSAGLGLQAAILSRLRCPVDSGRLRCEGDWLVSETGRHYPVVHGIPVLLRDDVADTLWVAPASRQIATKIVDGTCDDPFATESLGLTEAQRLRVRQALSQRDHQVDPVISAMVGATNGILYADLVERVLEVPIPKVGPLMGPADFMLDIGCNWGRWCISAAQDGRQVVGIDPSLGAVLAAQREAANRGLSERCAWVVADARYLPFESDLFSGVYSYSVLQHFSLEHAALAIKQAARVVHPGGTVLIQLANRAGIRSLQHQWRRGFRKAESFDVRYWSYGSMRRVFAESFSRVAIEADGFFGLGMRPEDAHLLGGWRGAIARISGVLVRISRVVPLLTRAADSLFVRAKNKKTSS